MLRIIRKIFAWNDSSQEMTFQPICEPDVQRAGAIDLSVVNEPIGQTNAPLSLPLWIDANGKDGLPSTYEHTFWFIEPLGEYIYFLAGNFDKAENGYLAFNSASTEMRAEVTFEDDSISVHKIDDWRIQGWAEQNMQYASELSHMTLGDVLDVLPSEANPDGILNVMPLNRKYQGVSRSGMARLEFVKHPETLKEELRMIFQAVHQAKGQPERLLTVLVRCSDREQNMGNLNSAFSDMIAKFENLPYEKLEGAIRM